MSKVINRSTAINFLIAVICLALQFNHFINIGKSSIFPLFPFAFVIVFSMFSSELTAFITGMVMGIFVDSSSSSLFSFNTIAYSLTAFLVSLLVHYLFNNNIRSCTVISFFSTAFLLLVRFIVSYSDLGLNYMLKNFLNSIVPSAVLTVIFAVLLFLAEKKIYKNAG